AAPSQVIAHPTEPRALVLARETGTVFDIDAVKLAVSRSGRAGNTAVAMRLSPANDAVWVLYRDPASLVEFPLQSMRPGRHIRLGAPPSGFDLNGRLAAVASAERRTIALASLDSGSIARTITVGEEPTLVAFRKDGRHLFAASRPGRSLG